MSVINRHKFGKREWIYMNLISTSSKFCDYVCGQKARVTPRNIYVGIINLKVAVENILKLRHMLDLIKKYVIHIIIHHLGVNVSE